MNKKTMIIGLILAVAVGGGFYYQSSQTNHSDAEHAEHKEDGHKEEKGGAAHDEHQEEKEGHEGHDEHEGETGSVKMTAEVQKENGVVVASAQMQPLIGVISVTGKIEANADRMAHVSSRISGKIVSVKASLGDSVAAGQTLAALDSVELGEALNRYHQSKTKLELAQSNMERIKVLVEKKIAARKDILQAETDYKTAQTELHTDEERLLLYGVVASELKDDHRLPLLPVRSPIGGTITEKHAIVGELADPSTSLYTVADLSTVWVLVDVNEKDLAKVHKGQAASVMVGAFPDLKLEGRITYIADLVNESTRTVKARIEVANPGRKLKPEMFATVELELASDSPSVLAIPEEAVQDLDGKKVVFVAESATEFVARTVQVGRMAGGMIEIVDGLKVGETYAIKGAFILKSEVKKGELVDEHGHG